MKTHRVLAIAAMLCMSASSLQAAPANDAFGIELQSLGADPVSLATYQETSKDMASEPRMSMHELEGAIDMTVRAKMFVSSKSHYKHVKSDGTEVEAANLVMYGVYRGATLPDGRVVNGVPENGIFGEATPGATVHLTIVNPDAHKQLEVGKEYYVDFSEAPTG